MPGLNLRGMGGASFSGGTGFSNPRQPATATQAAFGPGYGGNGMPSKTNALIPNDAFGVSLWTAVAAAGLLIFIRHSLPA